MGRSETRFTYRYVPWTSPIPGKPNDLGTIRTVPENYYVADVYEDLSLRFDSRLEAATRNVDRESVRKWWEQNKPRLEVKLWDGRVIPVKDRDEAVVVIKRELKSWMNPDDRLAWYNTDEDDRLKRKPSQAIVINSIGERSDAEAMIRYRVVTSGKPEMTKGRMGK